jgi:hypothetical protein
LTGAWHSNSFFVVFSLHGLGSDFHRWYRGSIFRPVLMSPALAHHSSAVLSGWILMLKGRLIDSWLVNDIVAVLFVENLDMGASIAQMIFLNLHEY